MDIGKEEKTIIVEPVEDPFEQPAEKPVAPEREPEKVPASLQTTGASVTLTDAAEAQSAQRRRGPRLD